MKPHMSGLQAPPPQVNSLFNLLSITLFLLLFMCKYLTNYLFGVFSKCRWSGREPRRRRPASCRRWARSTTGRPPWAARASPPPAPYTAIPPPPPPGRPSTPWAPRRAALIRRSWAGEAAARRTSDRSTSPRPAASCSRWRPRDRRLPTLRSVLFLIVTVRVVKYGTKPRL